MLEPKPERLFLGSDPVWAWLVHSYCYYIKAAPLMPDHKFDELCVYIYRNWDYIKSPYMDFIRANGFPIAESVQGTGFGELDEAYPDIIRIIYRNVGLREDDPDWQKLDFSTLKAPKKKPAKKPVPVVEEEAEDGGLSDMFV